MFKLKAAAITVLLCGGATSAMAGSADAMELSLVSGLFRNESYKTNGNDAGNKTTLEAGARLAAPLDGRFFWLAQGSLTLRNYTKGNNAEAPSSSSSLALGGGLRYYFNKLSEHVEPFANLHGEFRDSKDATPESGGYTESDKNGLYYGADFGIRLSLQKEFFVDFEVPLVDSALFATEKATAVTFGPPKVSNTSETKRTELFAKSTGSFNDFKVALGMRF